MATFGRKIVGCGSLLRRTPGYSMCRMFGQPAAQTHPHLLQEGEVTPGISKLEYKERRTKLMEKIAQTNRAVTCQNHIVIIPSAPKVYMSHDIPYPFRQNTDFLYLCGFLEPDSLLVLESTSDSLPEHKATLFVPKKDPHKELWEGARSGKQGAITLTGVDNACNTDDLNMYLLQYHRDNASAMVWYEYKKPTHLSYHLKLLGDFIKDNKFGFLESPRNLLQQLRLIKSPAERELMFRSNHIASEAFKGTMQFSSPGVNEADLYAKVDFDCRIGGAEQLAYPPVVAGGNRANTIHYISNNQIVDDGEMVLMDAGCEKHGYCSDITRTWPVSGSFTDPQLSLYEAVLEVQEACVALCGHEDMTLDVVFQEMLGLIGQQLSRLGIAARGTQGMELYRLAREICPHHVGHYLGMDVHDTDEMSRSLKLQPGMVITIEPGMYIPKSRSSVPAEFRGLGIRIEDDVLITEHGYTNLSAHCPKHPKDIENIMKQ